MNKPTYKVGQRVHEVERVNDLCKVVAVRETAEGQEYLVRQFREPHALFWTDGYHLSRPVGKTHDERN